MGFSARTPWISSWFYHDPLELLTRKSLLFFLNTQEIHLFSSIFNIPGEFPLFLFYPLALFIHDVIWTLFHRLLNVMDFRWTRQNNVVYLLATVFFWKNPEIRWSVVIDDNIYYIFSIIIFFSFFHTTWTIRPHLQEYHSFSSSRINCGCLLKFQRY